MSATFTPAQNLGFEPAVAIPTVSRNVTTDETTDYQSYGGLTKRERIAALAMQTLCGRDAPAKHVATEAVAYADALLAELAKPVTP